MSPRAWRNAIAISIILWALFCFWIVVLRSDAALTPRREPPVREWQARRILRSYATSYNFGKFRIRKCRHQRRTIVKCRVESAPYLDLGDDDRDVFYMRVKRTGYRWYVEDGGSGTAVGGFDVFGDWDRWL